MISLLEIIKKTIIDSFKNYNTSKFLNESKYFSNVYLNSISADESDFGNSLFERQIKYYYIQYQSDTMGDLTKQ